jgi:protein-S-isoprenylcysteine O-methyltransferase Ste14
MPETTDTKSLRKTALSRVSIIYLIMGLIFFLPAGTIKYWQAWSYLVTIAVPMIIFGLYMFKHDPKFIERRMRTKEKREKQRLILKLGFIPFLLAFILPGFDIRFGWSGLSPYISLAGLGGVLAGYLLCLKVFLTNSFASRVVDVEKEQKVITTGPYAYVRHPMYSAMIIFYLFTPLALGSAWAVVPALFIVPVLVVRLKDEEKELLENLAGYREYAEKVRHRLVPGVW